MLRQMSPSRSAAGSARTHAITWSVRRIPPAGYPEAGCGSRKNNDGTGAVPSGRGVSTLVLAGDRGNEVRAYPRTVGIIETRVFVVIELTRMPSRHDARPRAGRRGRAARRVRRCRATRDLCSSMCSHPRPHRAPARLTRQRSEPTQPQSPHHHNSDSASNRIWKHYGNYESSDVRALASPPSPPQAVWEERRDRERLPAGAAQATSASASASSATTAFDATYPARPAFA